MKKINFNNYKLYIAILIILMAANGAVTSDAGKTYIPNIYNYSRELVDIVSSPDPAAFEKAAEVIGSKVNTSGDGTPVLVFNPLAWKRTDIVEIDSPFDPEKTEAAIVTDGKITHPVQIEGDRLVFTAHDVPAVGYKVFWLKPAQAAAEGKVQGESGTIRNQFFIVKVDPTTGAISRIYDRINKREIVPSDHQAGILQILTEGVRAKETKKLDRAEVCELIEYGPERAIVRSEHSYGDSWFTQDVILYDNIPRIDIKMTADWREISTPENGMPVLKVLFPFRLSAPKTTLDIHSGSNDTTQNWADLAGKGSRNYRDRYGVSILDNCKYGYDVNGNALRLTLLKASDSSDPASDADMKEMTYSIYPHTGTWQKAGTPRRAYELNNPLKAIITESHSGSLPREMSFLSVEPGNLTVTDFKLSEDGKKLIVGLREVSGVSTTAVIRTILPIKTYTDEKTGEARKTAGKITIRIGKHERKTLRLTL